jgi:HK97 gp10 family phage protein
MAIGSITVRIDGIDDLQRKLAGGQVEAPIQRFLDRGAITIQGKAREKAPVDTGRLRNSIGVESPNDRMRRVGPNVHYGEYVEMGTRPHWAPQGALAGWAGRHGMTDYQARRAIAMRGTRAQPYMQPAADNARGGIAQLVSVLAAEIESAFQ